MDATNHLLLNKELLIPTSSFEEKGGWIVDNEFILTMGASYLLAHGLGTPVKNAKTTIISPKSGFWHVYAYTYNWVAPWHQELYTGRFQVKVGDALTPELGKSSCWSWEDGGKLFFKEGENTIELVDDTGFEGRCAFLYLSDTPKKLENGKDAIEKLYQEMVLSIYLLMQKLGLLGSYWSLLISYVVFTLPVGTWTLKSYFDSLPNSLIESAKVDGAKT